MERTADHSAFAELFFLARPLNAGIAFVVIFAAGVIARTESTNWTEVIVAAFAGTLLASAANMINDVFDIDTDRVNKPQRPLPAGRLSRRTAAIGTAFTAVSGLIISHGAGEDLFFLALASSILIFAYSAWLKRIPLLGNLTVAALTAVAFLFGALAAGNIHAGITPALFALGYNLGREILKDVEDIEGDRSAGIRTFPMITGIRSALLTASVIFAGVLAATVLPYALGEFGILYLLIVVPGVDGLLVFVIRSMWRDRSTPNLARLNVWLKYGMLAGVLAMAAGSWQ